MLKISEEQAMSLHEQADMVVHVKMDATNTIVRFWNEDKFLFQLYYEDITTIATASGMEGVMNEIMENLKKFLTESSGVCSFRFATAFFEHPALKKVINND